MSLPDKFILAFPVAGNVYIHYKAYWVDLTAKSIVVTVNRHDRNYAGLSFRENRHMAVLDTLEERMEGKPPYPHDRRFITNGIVETNCFMGMDMRRPRDKHERIPVRFIPVSASFANWNITSSKYSKDDPLLKLEDELDDAVYALVDGSQWWWADCLARVSFANDDGRIMKMLETLFHSMSHSQVKMTCDMNYQGEKRDRARSLYELYARNIRPCTSDDVAAKLKAVYPDKESKSKSFIASLKKRCLERFIRRHPTKATATLLKLMAAFGAKPALTA